MAGESAIQVKIDDTELKLLQQRVGLAERDLKRVLSRAINSTASSSRTETKRAVLAKAPYLPSSQVLRRLFIRPKASPSKLITYVNAAAMPIPVIKTKGVKGGQIVGKPGHKRRRPVSWAGGVLAHAFRATMLRGHTGIFMRKYLGGGKPILTFTGQILGEGQKMVPRKPIQELGVSLGHSLWDVISPPTEQWTTRKLKENVEGQVKLILERGV